MVVEDKFDCVYIVYNKFIGIICIIEWYVKGNIIDVIKYKECIFLIGCLDKFFEGFILLISDGDIVNKILCVENVYDKEYEVIVN